MIQQAPVQSAILLRSFTIGHRLVSSTSRRYSTCTSHAVPAAPYDILFCGTDTFASTCLSSLTVHSHLCASLHVLTPPDNAQKWGGSRMKSSAVKQVALQHLLTHQHVPAGGMVDYHPPDSLIRNPKAILVTCSFGHLIPDGLLDVFPNPWQRLNVHPSLLPELRGAAPIQWALARRMSRSGVSVQTLERGKFDTGRIVAQVQLDFPPPNMAGKGFVEVEQVMAERAAGLLISTLKDLPGCWATSWDQDEQHRSYAPKLKSQHSVVRWDRWSAHDVVAREQGFAYLYPLSTTLLPPPSASSTFRPVSLTLSNTSTLPLVQLRTHDPPLASLFASPTTPAGSALYSAHLDALVVKCHSSDVLTVRTVKVANKKAKSAHDWYAAYRDRAERATGLVRFA